MTPSLAIAATTLAVVGAVAEAGGDGARPATVRRRLSYKKIAGYGPNSLVTDHCAIDLDQAAIEEQLALETTESFANARRIYLDGGNSASYARLTLAKAGGLAFDLRDGDRVLGTTADGLVAAGTAYGDHGRGDHTIEVRYAPRKESHEVGCRVGALVEPTTEECFAATGEVEIDGAVYPYSYDPHGDNRNGRTLASLAGGGASRGGVVRPDDPGSDVAAGGNPPGCRGCASEEYRYFLDYYGASDYAHRCIEAAFAGGRTRFPRGNADFSRYGLEGRGKFVERATAVLGVFASVLRRLEEALDDCERGCVDCNRGPAHDWDEGVCFYTGSLEGTDGLADDGRLLHQLADDLCGEYRTCGVEGTDLAGQSKLNYDVLGLFSLGNFQILTGNCPAARTTARDIVAKMYVPLIQGLFLHAHRVDELGGGEATRAEGAAFAAALLPRIHAVSSDAARNIYDNMKVGAASTDFASVKESIECTYPMLGIKCEDVGGIWDESSGTYRDGAGPCDDDVLAAAATIPKDYTLAIVLGGTFGALFAAAIGAVFFMRRREREGRPVFDATMGSLRPNEMSAEILGLFQRRKV